jgi:ribonuclease P protein component
VQHSQAFPKSERLTRRSAYLRVYDQGSKRVGRYFICHVERHGEQQRKFGMAVSRRVGGAVVRNRVKRYLREIYRRERASLTDGFHLVLVARSSAADLNFHQCGKEIQRMLRAEGIVRE